MLLPTLMPSFLGVIKLPGQVTILIFISWCDFVTGYLDFMSASFGWDITSLAWVVGFCQILSLCFLLLSKGTRLLAELQLCCLPLQAMGKLMETGNITVFDPWLIALWDRQGCLWQEQARELLRSACTCTSDYQCLAPVSSPLHHPTLGTRDHLGTHLLWLSSSPSVPLFPFSHPTSWHAVQPHGVSSRQLGCLPMSPRHSCNCWAHARQLVGVSSASPPSILPGCPPCSLASLAASLSPGPPQICGGWSQGLEVPLYPESLQVRLQSSIPPPLLSHPAHSQVRW